MGRLEELLLFILDRANKKGIDGLSTIQMFKIPYLIQVESLKYTGKPFVDLLSMKFVRETNGPISLDIYNALDVLKRKKRITVDVVENKSYGKNRHNHKLVKKLTKSPFSDGETIFLDSLLNEYLDMTIMNMKRLAYETEPMVEIIKSESKKKINKGKPIDLSVVSLDPDIVDVLSST